jgi:hypothetical protein
VLGVVAAGTAAMAFRQQPAGPAAVPGHRPTTSTATASFYPTTAPPVSASAIAGPARSASPQSLSPERPGPVPSKTAAPTVPCAGHPAGTDVAFSRRLFSSPAGATERTDGGTTLVRFDNRYTWAGLMLTLPRGTCRYRIDLEARMVEPSREMSDDEGWGYGIGPCNLLTGRHPFGYSLQHAMIKQSGVVSGNSGAFRNPDVNDGTVVDVPADYGWHQWTFLVDGDTVTVTREFGIAVTTGRVSGATGLPANCDRAGIFLRVFNGAAEFRDISVTAL